MSRLDGTCTQLQGMHISSSSYDMHLSSSSYVHTTLRSVYARPAGQGLSFSFFFRPPGVNLCSTLKGVQTSRRPRSTYHYGRSGHGGSAICRIYPGTFCFVFFSFLPFFFLMAAPIVGFIRALFRKIALYSAFVLVCGVNSIGH